MSDFLGSGAFTWFDLIVVTIMVISGLMALARGFIREIASIFAFQSYIAEGISIQIANSLRSY